MDRARGRRSRTHRTRQEHDETPRCAAGRSVPASAREARRCDPLPSRRETATRRSSIGLKLVDAFDHRTLLNAHYGELWRFARKASSGDDEATEVLHDLAVVVLARASAPSEPSSFFRWCCGVAWNLGGHRLRRLRSEPRQDPDGEGPPRVTTTRDVEEALERRSLLEACLRGLEHDDRALLIARFVFEETPAEMSSRLHISPVAVRMRVHRLLKGTREGWSRRSAPRDAAATAPARR